MLLMSDTQADRVAAGRDALRRHAWHEAFEHLLAADQQEALAPEVRLGR
jgi:hypothetical protein